VAGIVDPDAVAESYAVRRNRSDLTRRPGVADELRDPHLRVKNDKEVLLAGNRDRAGTVIAALLGTGHCGARIGFPPVSVIAARSAAVAA
jgi:hypothetical protein